MSKEKANKEEEDIYYDPLKYVPRYITLNGERYEISELIATQLERSNMFIMWGLPGSGKTTIARHAAEIMYNKGYRPLHIIFGYNDALLIPKAWKLEDLKITGEAWRKPPVIMLNINNLTEDKIRYLTEILEKIAKGTEGGASERYYIKEIYRKLNDLVYGSDSESMCEKFEKIVKNISTLIYLTSLIPIDFTGLVDCKNLEMIKNGVERLLNISLRRRSMSSASTTVSGVLVIFDNLDKNKRFLDKNVFFFIEERIKSIESSKFKKLIVYTINESEYIETKIKSTPANFPEKITKEIANGLNLDPDLVRGHLLPSFIPYPTIEELIEIIRANNIEVGRDLNRDRLEVLASCSGWQIPLILNYLKIKDPSDISVSCPRIESL